MQDGGSTRVVAFPSGTDQLKKTKTKLLVIEAGLHQMRRELYEMIAEVNTTILENKNLQEATERALKTIENGEPK